MRTSLLSAQLLTLLLLVGAPAIAQGDAELDLTLDTDLDVYGPSEPVTITATVCNPTDEPVTLYSGCPCCHDELEILDGGGNTVASLAIGCITAVWVDTWQPGQCKQQVFTWGLRTGEFFVDGSSDGEVVAPGRYVARYRWFPSGDTPKTVTVDFTFLLTTLPTASTLGLVILALVLAALGALRLRRV